MKSEKLSSRLLILGTVIALTSLGSASESVEALFDAKCAVCHSKARPTDMSKVTAPALMGIMRHIKMEYPQKDEAVKFMVDYVLDPKQEKAICMPEKIQRFGLMPSQKGSVSPEELEKIANWMFDNYPPADFQGMRRGRGMGRGEMQ